MKTAVQPRAGRCAWSMLLVLAMFATTADAVDYVRIEFRGRLLPGTCNIATGDASKQVVLPDIGTRAFQHEQAQGHTDFAVNVDECAGVRRVRFSFSGMPDPLDGRRWRNDGDAGNLAVWVFDPEGGTICATSEGCVREVERGVLDGAASLRLKAAYWRVAAGPVRAGSVRSTLAVTLTYE